MIYSAQKSFRAMLGELGITDSPGRFVYHRTLTGPDGEDLGQWEANERLSEVLKSPDPLAEFRRIAAQRALDA